MIMTVLAAERAACRRFEPLHAFPRSVLVVLVALFLSTGCDDEEPRTTDVQVVVHSSSGEFVTDFLAIVRRSDGPEVLELSCPGEAVTGSGGLVARCTDQGLALDDPEKRATSVLLKAHGHHFAEVDLVAGETSVDLAPLAPFETNDDYRTGLEAASGLADFRALAFSQANELGATHVVKFTIALGDEPEVYLQNTPLHLLHYDFVRSTLKEPISLPDFDKASHGPDRRWTLGNLLYAPDLAVSSPRGDLEAHRLEVEAPILLQFFPSDDLNPEQVLQAHRLLEERLQFLSWTGPKPRLVYVPAGSTQEADLLAAADSFAAAGVPWLDRTEAFGNIRVQLLNPGVAYGTLRPMTPDELATTPLSFRDILWLTKLANELPLVGGTITEELQTPLAHVNVAARARGTPNLALLDAGQDQALLALQDQLVRFEVRSDGYSVEPATLIEADAFWASRTQHLPLVPVADVTRSGLLGFAEIGFADAEVVGVKAANVAELSHFLGARAPHGFAVPFFYYDTFMSTSVVLEPGCVRATLDCQSSGRALAACDAATARCLAAVDAATTLQGYAEGIVADAALAADTAERDAVLDGLRSLIKNGAVEPSFAQALDARVAQEFGSDKVRLRSSTNAEDLAEFSGAGLYESIGAEAVGSKSASRRIREVWASTWTWRAFEERAFWNVDQHTVRMGVLVHQAFQDEAANGVLITQNLTDAAVQGMYVNVQKGEVSVTNPVNGALPEIFSVVPGPGGIQVARQRFSSLSLDEPLLSDDEVTALYKVAAEVQVHFCELYGEDPYSFTLDLEFKFVGPERALIIKQTRPYYQRTNGGP